MDILQCGSLPMLGLCIIMTIVTLVYEIAGGKGEPTTDGWRKMAWQWSLPIVTRAHWILVLGIAVSLIFGLVMVKWIGVDLPSSALEREKPSVPTFSDKAPVELMELMEDPGTRPVALRHVGRWITIEGTATKVSRTKAPLTDVMPRPYRIIEVVLQWSSDGLYKEKWVEIYMGTTAWDRQADKTIRVNGRILHLSSQLMVVAQRETSTRSGRATSSGD